MKIEQKRQKRRHRHRRVRAKVSGTAKRPRLNVFKSNQHIHLQLIDDTSGRTLAAASSVNKTSKKSGVELARGVAEELAEKAQKQGISQAVFDRGGYKYHGQVKAVAEAVRDKGIKI